MNIQIDLLKNHSDSITDLVKIWQEVLGNIWVPDISYKHSVTRFQAHLNEDTLPLTLVAIHDGIPIGMCSLRENDGIRPELKPWLGSLVVDPNYQSLGVGKQLINAIVKKANELGFQKIYLFTFDPSLPIYYAKLGWQKIGTDNFKNHTVDVMEVDTSLF